MVLNNNVEKKIFNVTELTKKIHETLDTKFSFFWVTGEISNFASPASGHFYFSLKDSKSLINAVIFKNQRKNLKFMPENGLEVIGFGRISVYAPRGSYQVIFEYLEPKGLGSLQLLFEQTKEKLKNLGYFDENHKKELPFLPEKISLITSPTGAALQDMLKIIGLRYPDLNVEICPVKVQGKDAEFEIIDALKKVNKAKTSDIIIIARGGGSFEDLMPFNSEELAVEVFKSEIPVVTGVGHETDFTIIDFVADFRAPTPTAAAEYSVPNKNDLLNTVRVYEDNLVKAFKKQINSKFQSLNNLKARLRDPEKHISMQRLYLDEKTMNLNKRMGFLLRAKSMKIEEYDKKLSLSRLSMLHSRFKNDFVSKRSDLLKNFELKHKNKKINFEKVFAKFYELGPYTILGRGYSITRNLESRKIVRSVKKDVKKDDQLEVRIYDGKIVCKVNEIIEDKT